MTVGSMICDLDERRLYACAGPPCENPYQVFEMDGGVTVHDLVVAGGRVVDGCGNPWYAGDVAVRGDRIAAIGAPGTLRGRRVVDAGGRYVTPGFIDPHTHSDLSILLHPRAETAVRAGGHHARHRQLRHVGGAAHRDRAPRRRRPELGALRLGAGRRRLGLAHVRSVPEAPGRPASAINIAPLVGHGALRLAVVGFAERAVTAARAARAWSVCSTPPCAPAPTACRAASSTRRAASRPPRSC